MLEKLGRPWLKWSMRIIVAGLLVAAIIVVASSADEWYRQISGFSWEFGWLSLSLSVILLGVSYYFIPVGWIMIAHAAGSSVGSSELRRAWFLSQIGRYIPGKVWLFAGRAAFLKARGMTGYRATSVPFLELLYTAAGAGLSAVVPVLLCGGPVFSNSGLRIGVIAAGAAMVSIPFLSPLQKWLYRIKFGEVPDRLPLPDASGTVKLLLLYLALWWTRGVVLFLWLRGFGILGIDLLLCVAAAPLAWLAGYIVFLVPGGIGVREAAATAMIAPAGSTGPILAVIAGQRLILSAIEVFFALTSAGRTRMFTEGKEA